MIRVCKLCRLLVPWVMILLIRVPSSPSSPITMSLPFLLSHLLPLLELTVTFGISVPVISVHDYWSHFHPTVFVALETNYLDLYLCYTENPLVTDHGQLLNLDDHTSYQSSLRFHGHMNFYHVNVLVRAIPQYSLSPLYLVGLVADLSGPADVDYFSVVMTSLL